MSNHAFYNAKSAIKEIERKLTRVKRSNVPELQFQVKKLRVDVDDLQELEEVAEIRSDLDALESVVDGKRDKGVDIPMSEVAGLSEALEGTTVEGHTHSIAQVTGLQSALDSKAANTDLEELETHVAEAGVINVLLHGVVSDAFVTDQSEAVQDILDLFPGRIIYFPAGQYMFHNAHPKEGTTVRGDGRATQFKITDGAVRKEIPGMTQIKLGIFTVSEDYVTLEDFSVDGNRDNLGESSTGHQEHEGVELDNCDHCVIRRLFITNVQCEAIDVDKCEHVVVEDCEMIDIGGYGVHMSGHGDGTNVRNLYCYINRCYFKDCAHIRSGSAAIDVWQRAGYCRVSNCTIEDCVQGINLPSNSRGSDISHCVIYDCPNQALNVQGAWNKISDLTIRNCGTSSGEAITFSGTSAHNLLTGVLLVDLPDNVKPLTVDGSRNLIHNFLCANTGDNIIVSGFETQLVNIKITKTSTLSGSSISLTSSAQKTKCINVQVGRHIDVHADSPAGHVYIGGDVNQILESARGKFHIFASENTADPGYVFDTGNQTIGGVKTFTDTVNTSNQICFQNNNVHWRMGRNLSETKVGVVTGNAIELVAGSGNSDEAGFILRNGQDEISYECLTGETGVTTPTHMLYGTVRIPGSLFLKEQESSVDAQISNLQTDLGVATDFLSDVNGRVEDLENASPSGLSPKFVGSRAFSLNNTSLTVTFSNLGVTVGEEQWAYVYATLRVSNNPSNASVWISAQNTTQFTLTRNFTEVGANVNLLVYVQ